jgi:acetylcholinesterase
MILLKSILSAAAVLLLSCHVDIDAVPVKLQKRLLLPTAPKASDIDGAHLLLKNDVDSSNIIKNAYLLLSKPRDYYSGMNACLSMGDGELIEGDGLVEL